MAEGGDPAADADDNAPAASWAAHKQPAFGGAGTSSSRSGRSSSRISLAIDIGKSTFKPNTTEKHQHQQQRQQGTPKPFAAKKYKRQRQQDG